MFKRVYELIYENHGRRRVRYVDRNGDAFGYGLQIQETEFADQPPPKRLRVTIEEIPEG